MGGALVHQCMAEKKRKLNPNSLKNLEKGRKFSKNSEEAARKEA